MNVIIILFHNFESDKRKCMAFLDQHGFERNSLLRRWYPIMAFYYG